MSDDYGSELRNVLNGILPDQRPLAADVTSYGPSISSVFRSLARIVSDPVGGTTGTPPQILYFPPGRYVLNRSPELNAETFTVPKESNSSLPMTPFSASARALRW